MRDKEAETERRKERQTKGRRQFESEIVSSCSVHLKVIQGVIQLSFDEVGDHVPLWLEALCIAAEGAQTTHHLGVLPDQATVSR